MTNKKLTILRSVVDEIVESLSGKPVEQGGIIGCREEFIITDFIYDSNPKQNSVSSYSPNTDFLNNAIGLKWKKKNIRFCGFIHSHFINGNLSAEDIEYARKILRCFENYESLLMGIAVLNRSSQFLCFKWYEVRIDGVTELEFENAALQPYFKN